jgi:hypothetical protein
LFTFPPMGATRGSVLPGGPCMPKDGISFHIFNMVGAYIDPFPSIGTKPLVSSRIGFIQYSRSNILRPSLQNDREKFCRLQTNVTILGYPPRSVAHFASFFVLRQGINPIYTKVPLHIRHSTLVKNNVSRLPECSVVNTILFP